MKTQSDCFNTDVHHNDGVEKMKMIIKTCIHKALEIRLVHRMDGNVTDKGLRLMPALRAALAPGYITGRTSVHDPHTHTDGV